MGAKGHTFLSGHDKWGEKVGPAEFYTYLERYGWTYAASVYAAYSEGRDYNRYALRLFLDDCSRREGPDNRYSRHYVEKTLARMDGESEDDSMFVPKEEDEFPLPSPRL